MPVPAFWQCSGFLRRERHAAENENYAGSGGGGKGELAAGLHGFLTAPSGARGLILTLTNTSQTQSCSVYGYTGLGLQNSRHHALPSRTFWGSTAFDRDPGRSLIVLSPGETTSASLSYVATGGKSAVRATYLEATPPNDYLHLVIRFPYSVGHYIEHGYLYVTAMARHTPFS